MGCQLSGGSRGGPGPPSFLDQSESRRALKKFLETAAPVPLSKGLDDWGPTPLPRLDLALQLVCGVR